MSFLLIFFHFFGCLFFFFFQAEDGIRDADVTGVQTCAFRSSSRSWACAESIPISRTSRVAAIAKTPSLKVSSLVVPLSGIFCVKLTYAVDVVPDAPSDRLRAGDRRRRAHRQSDGLVLVRPARLLCRDGRWARVALRDPWECEPG